MAAPKSIYAPRAEGQLLALQRTYAVAGYRANTVGLVEAHGTGTTAGDLAEITALKAKYSANAAIVTRPWGDALGSIGSPQIGHTKAGRWRSRFALYKAADGAAP